MYAGTLVIGSPEEAKGRVSCLEAETEDFLEGLLMKSGQGPRLRAAETFDRRASKTFLVVGRGMAAIENLRCPVW